MLQHGLIFSTPLQSPVKSLNRGCDKGSLRGSRVREFAEFRVQRFKSSRVAGRSGNRMVILFLLYAFAVKNFFVPLRLCASVFQKANNPLCFFVSFAP
jgi:hypothetical protein